MTTEKLHDLRGWTASTVDNPAAWSYRLPAGALEVFRQKIHSLRGKMCPITDVRLSSSERTIGLQELTEVRHPLEQGRGFAIVEGVPLDEFASHEVQIMYWLVGQALG